jgi:RHS repeat-associated protein
VYRYGFNGKENDNEVSGNGNKVDFGARIYDSRLGRWLSVDPLAKDYSQFSTYCYVSNNPIAFIDPDGKKIVIYYQELVFNPATGREETKYHQYDYRSALAVPSNKYVQETVKALDYLYNQIPNGVGNIDGNYLGNQVNILTDILNSPLEAGILINENSLVISADPATGAVTFNPYSGLDIGGKVQTPALGLLHELGHTWGTLFDNANQKIRKALTTNSGSHSNGEEHFVITRIETNAANILREPARLNHGGTDFKTSGSTTTEPYQDKLKRDAIDDIKRAIAPLDNKKGNEN